MKLNIQRFADGQVEIEVDLNTKSFERQIANLEYELDELRETYKLALKDPDFDPKALRNLGEDIEKAQNKLTRLREQQSKLNIETKNYDNSLGNGFKKLSKMGLAIFGIRSAFMLIKQSATQLAEQNDVLASKLTAIKGALTNALAPVVEVIVNLVYRLLSYLNVITKTFLGVDLFKNSAKSSKKTLSNAKKLSKTIASFDEMNILNDNTKTAGGGGDKTKLPEPIDTSGFEKALAKFRKMWNDLLKIDREEAKKLFLNGEDLWGALKLLVFDYVQGSVKELDGLWDAVKGGWDIIVGYATGNQEKIDRGQKQLIDGLKKYWDGFKQTIKGVLEYPVNQGAVIGTKIKTLFIDKVIKPITDKIDAIKNRIKDNFKDGFWKGIANTFIDIMNKAIDKINSKFSFTISNGTATVLRALGINAKAGKYQVLTIPKIPKLAKGGIVNMPGKGVPIGSALAGENGREGVIPLTDSQQMALLGEAIGRYITINANITNTMNGRVISRELQKINNENSFASNL